MHNKSKLVPTCHSSHNLFRMTDTNENLCNKNKPSSPAIIWQQLLHYSSSEPRKCSSIAESLRTTAYQAVSDPTATSVREEILFQDDKCFLNEHQSEKQRWDRRWQTTKTNYPGKNILENRLYTETHTHKKLRVLNLPRCLESKWKAGRYKPCMCRVDISLQGRQLNDDAFSSGFACEKQRDRLEKLNMMAGGE